MRSFRVHQNVPSVYAEDSRDFQLIGKLYDCIINGVRFDVHSVQEVSDTDKCPSTALSLLKSKVGFFTNMSLGDAALRKVLSAFPYIMKYKGSKRSIVQTVNLFLRINNIKNGAVITITNDGTESEEYTIKIGIESNKRDTTLMEEIFKYILPTGYNVKYYFYSGTSYQNLMYLSDTVTYTFLTEFEGSNSASSEINSYGIAPRQGKAWMSDTVNIIAGYYNNNKFFKTYSEAGGYEDEYTITGVSNSIYFFDVRSGFYVVSKVDDGVVTFEKVKSILRIINISDIIVVAASPWNALNHPDIATPQKITVGDSFGISGAIIPSEYSEYDSTKSYIVGDKAKVTDASTEVSQYYICKEATTGTFDTTKWERQVNKFPNAILNQEDGNYYITACVEKEVSIGDYYVFNGAQWEITTAPTSLSDGSLVEYRTTLMYYKSGKISKAKTIKVTTLNPTILPSMLN